MLERSVLEAKDREQLLAIAQALGVKSVSRAKKVDLIAKILEQTGVDVDVAAGETSASAEAPEVAFNGHDSGERSEAIAASNGAGVNGSTPAPAAGGAPDQGQPDEVQVVLGPDGEPLAEWEIALAVAGDHEDADDLRPEISSDSDGSDGDSDGEVAWSGDHSGSSRDGDPTVAEDLALLAEPAGGLFDDPGPPTAEVPVISGDDELVRGFFEPEPFTDERWKGRRSD